MKTQRPITWADYAIALRALSGAQQRGAMTHAECEERKKLLAVRLDVHADHWPRERTQRQRS
jgi:hypothetical protein